MAVVVGIILTIVGVALATNALDLTHHVARVWPRPFGRGDVDRLASTTFLMRFVGLLVALAGAAMVLIPLVPD